MNFDSFVEIMQVVYRSELDVNIYTPSNTIIEYRVFKPYSKFEEYLSIYIHQSNQTRGLYVDHTHLTGDVKSNINIYEVPNTLKKWEETLSVVNVTPDIK